MINLEPLCAGYGHKMIIRDFNDTAVSDQENVVTRALGVLAENGIYAMCIYLLSCSKKEYGKTILRECIQGLWLEEQISLLEARSRNDSDLLENVRKITENLPQLILAKKITEQTLTFARYHAKADIAGTSQN